MRKLATIRKIVDIKPIEGADMIEVAVIDGWECVVKKSEELKVGDLVVYIEIDSIVPDRPEFEFLRDRKFRVRTIKLRKQISQGLVLPLSILPNCKTYKEEDDVTDILGIKKYDPEGDKERQLLTQKADNSKNPIVKFLMRFKWFRKRYIKPKKGGFPSWIVKTDEERIQNKTTMFNIEKEAGTEFTVTEKIDGQSVTYFLEKVGRKYNFGVCSRNIYLKKPDNSSYWTIAKQLDIENVLKSIIGKHNRIVLQGEIIGEGIQGNKYKIKGYDFYAFNLIYPDHKTCSQEIFYTLHDCGIKTVPILDSNFKLRNCISEMVDCAKGDSVLLTRKREGIVVRANNKDISFKVINPEFLLAEEI
jgi:hypothetical protein